MSKMGIFGAGWVGLVTGACFAELGHEIVIRDVVPPKIDALQRGEVPFHEDKLPELLASNADRITYTLEAEDVSACEFLFVCVDTPPTTPVTQTCRASGRSSTSCRSSTDIRFSS